MFKVGDKVKVVKKVEGSDKPFWVVPEMDRLIGLSGEVISNVNDFIGVNFSLGNTWCFDPESLEFVDGKKIESTDKSNPKAAIGATALPMTMLSPLACAMGALGKFNGMQKYGLANFIGTEVRMSVYLDAIRRHFDAILMGEDVDPIDKVPHWGAIMANIDIIICAQAAGTLIDDRPRSDGQLDAVRSLKPLVESLQKLHAEKNPHHYYMKNKDADQN